MSTESKLQEGIYYSKGSSPGKFFCILFLRADSSRNAAAIGEYISGLWNMYSNLRKGIINDLDGHEVPHGNLNILVGYGLNIFSLKGIKKNIPPYLTTFGKFNSPLQSGGGPIFLGAGLKYDDNLLKNVATEDLALQFTADSQLAVNRCIVETWKHFHDNVNPQTGKAPLSIIHFFSGFQRDDFRSMLDFHDGLSNMKSGKPRLDAIAIKPSGVEEERWTENGTYLAFLRLAVDLGIWRKIPRIRQEIIVGRDKLTGCPIIDMDSNGNPIVTAGCPVPGTKAVTQPGNEIFHDIAIGDIRNDELKRSHVIRSNLKRGEPALRDSLRIFRQGYEFLEPIEKEPGFRVGLNFVSFQDTPERLYRMLTNPNWLGNTNFGGNSDTSLPGMDKLLSVMAGGIYLVPPISRSEGYPGSSIFI